MKIVRFNSGKFGVRKGYRFTGYYFLCPQYQAWLAFSDSKEFRDRCMMSREEADNAVEALKPKKIDYGTPISMKTVKGPSF